MRNQFGQDIKVGDWVGYTSRTGSTIIRKIGTVISFSERKNWRDIEPTVVVQWKVDGTWHAIENIEGPLSRGVGLNTVFKLDPRGLPAD